MIFTLQLTFLERIPSKGKCCFHFSKEVKLVFMAEMYLAMIATAPMKVLLYKDRECWFQKSFINPLIIEYTIQVTTFEA